MTRASEVRIGQVTAEESLTVGPGASLVMQGLGEINTGGGSFLKLNERFMGSL